MKVGFISTASLNNVPRLSTMRLQSEMIDAQKELSTGRHADIGSTLGATTGRTVALRQDRARLTEIMTTNELAGVRLEGTQSALNALSETATKFLSTLLGARNGINGPDISQGVAETALRSFSDVMNTSLNGEFIFAGINTDVKPLADYFGNPSQGNATAVATAFQSAFGVVQSDLATRQIAPADMQAFLDTQLAAEFDSAAWSTNWSSAADQNIRSRISTNELIDTSTNANDQAFRKLASAFTMVADIGSAELNEQTFHVLIDTAVKVVGDAIQDLTRVQATIGISQGRITEANERMNIQADLMDNHINVLEGVDSYEAATRVSTLMTQIETAYAMTAKIQQMSLLKYI